MVRVWLMTRLKSGFDQALPCVRIIACGGGGSGGGGRRGGGGGGVASGAARCRCVGAKHPRNLPAATLPHPARQAVVAPLGHHPRGPTPGYQLCRPCTFVYACQGVLDKLP